ncbi:MAG: hypothetical protein WCG94_05150, partial [Methanothrix sp.]
SGAYVTTYTPPQDSSKQSSYLLPVGAAALIALIAGGYLYRKRKLSNNANNKPQNGNRVS